MTYFLPRVVGPSRALEILLEDPNLKRREALEEGLVSAVVPADELIDTARAKAAKLAAMAPHYVKMAKRLWSASASRTASPSTCSSSATGSPTAWRPRICAKARSPSSAARSPSSRAAEPNCAGGRIRAITV